MNRREFLVSAAALAVCPLSAQPEPRKAAWGSRIVLHHTACKPRIRVGSTALPEMWIDVEGNLVVPSLDTSFLKLPVTERERSAFYEVANDALDN